MEEFLRFIYVCVCFVFYIICNFSFALPLIKLSKLTGDERWQQRSWQRVYMCERKWQFLSFHFLSLVNILVSVAGNSGHDGWRRQRRWRRWLVFCKFGKSRLHFNLQVNVHEFVCTIYGGNISERNIVGKLVEGFSS